KDLAAANIFPGDLLLKNFGVSRHGRVIFYDYDELATLTECRFRRLPVARSVDDELAAEPWFSVADYDVFPEEFTAFMVPPVPLRLGREFRCLQLGVRRHAARAVAAGEIEHPVVQRVKTGERHELELVSHGPELALECRDRRRVETLPPVERRRAVVRQHLAWRRVVH